MAVSVGFGVIFATGITLILLPMILLMGDDLKKILRNSLQAWKSVLPKEEREATNEI